MSPLGRWALLSIFAAVTTIAMKGLAYAVSGSAGLLSDALESLVNLAAALTAYLSLWYASHPADATHTFGHEKIEYFASGLEGVLILIAGFGAFAIGVDRLLQPKPLADLDLGLLLGAAAMLVNLVVGLLLLKAGRARKSIVLEADGKHLLSDVLTTVGVLVGLGFAALTGWFWIDPVLAMLVSLAILITGYSLIRRSFNGLMDHALPPAEQEVLRALIRSALPPGTDFHALRTRTAGRRTFAEFHLLVPGRWSVSESHALAHRVESCIHDKVPELSVTIHIEPIDEKASWETAELQQLGEVP